jgi:hypothetical protein
MPGSMGSINHSSKFCRNFGRVMLGHLRLCVALQHWAQVPALRMASDFSRVVDGFTCLGEPTQIVVHIITLPSGDLEWMLIDIVPNAAHATYVQEGRGPETLHKFKSAVPAAQVIRAVETLSCSMSDGEAGRRHACTCADGAYIGKWSVQLVPEWLQQVGSVGSLISESACEFHLLQGIGKRADGIFHEISLFSDHLRWLKARFSFGGRRLLLRAAATKLGEKLAAIGAPRSDDFKVTLYARRHHINFMTNYRAFRLALAVDLQIMYHNLAVQTRKEHEARLAAFSRGERKNPPKAPAPDTGKMRREYRTFRQEVRQLLDPKFLLIGIGRGDLRNLFLASYATFTQKFDVSTFVVDIGWLSLLTRVAMLSQSHGPR